MHAKHQIMPMVLIGSPGPFVRFGPNRIFVNTAEGLQKIYGSKANTTKSSYYNVFGEVFRGDSSLTTIDHQIHAKKKRVVSSALSESSIRSMEKLVLRNIRVFCTALAEPSPDTPVNLVDGAWGPPKNMTDWADYLSFDIMSDICFSSSSDMLRSGVNRYILKILPEGVNGLNVVSERRMLCKSTFGANTLSSAVECQRSFASKSETCSFLSLTKTYTAMKLLQISSQRSDYVLTVI
jgi:hypothetical protein